MTLSDFERHFVGLLLDYHHQPHRGLHGMTPAGSWDEYWRGRNAQPPTPADPRNLLIDFLPIDERRVQRDGVHLHNTRYWHDELSELIGHGDKIAVRTDPRDITKAYVQLPDGRHVDAYSIELGDSERPISLWEYRERRRLSKQQGKTAQEKRREWRRAREKKQQRRRNLTHAPKTAGHPPDYSSPVEQVEVSSWDD